MRKKSFTVKVPASSGNLGPGFDVLGLALALRNDVRVKVIGSRGSKPKINVFGEGSGIIPKDWRNLVYIAVKYIAHQAKRSIPEIQMDCVNRIPLSRGLGSSSAAILAGLLIGNELTGRKFNRPQILAMANKIEGHPDNVASALLGGVQASKVVGEKVVTSSWPVPKAAFVAAVPSFHLSTEKARKVVPKNLARAKAISNLASVSLMQEAFGKRPDLLREILDDQWHEPYRAKLIPGFYSVRKAAVKAGAYGMTLSGAGPTLLAWVPPTKRVAVGRAMERALRRYGIWCKILNLKIDLKGASVQ